MYDIYKSNHLVVSKEVVNVVDLGYLGIEKDFPDLLSSALPYRKKRNQDLLQEEIDYNKIHSRKRLVIEHTICRLKKYRVISGVFRNRLRKYKKISDIAAGLENYRIMNRPRFFVIIMHLEMFSFLFVVVVVVVVVCCCCCCCWLLLLLLLFCSIIRKCISMMRTKTISTKFYSTCSTMTITFTFTSD